MNHRGLATPTWGRIRPRDVVLAVVVAAVQIGITAGPISHHSSAYGCFWSGCTANRLGVVGYVLLALGPLVLLARRRAPRAALAAVFLITAAYACLGYPAGPIFLSLIIAFATVVVAGHRWVAISTIVVGWAVFLWVPPVFNTGHDPTVPQTVGLAAWLLVLLFAAEVVRGRHERITAQRRSHEEEGKRRAEEERLRIARELHDVLAHNISLINVQSGVALHLLDERPEQARSALSIINEASAEALREMRSVLGVLRRVDEQAPRTPAAGLEHLDELVDRAAAAGVSVQMRREGEPRPVATAVDLAAYRIIQESLTNVVRHAGGGEATVALAYGADGLSIEVENDGIAERRNGHPGSSPGSGNGIAGMRERAAALGGRLEAGPRPDGGFRIRARLPYAGGDE